MHLLPTLLALTGLATALPSSQPISGPKAVKTSYFNNRVIYTPATNYTDPRVLYARTVELSDGSLLATWENYSPEPPLVYLPIHQSLDRGATWRPLSQVHDTVNDWGLRYQPFLYELPRRIGRFPAGTVLAAANSIPTDLSQTQIDIYASADRGLTWTFVSSVAAGGRAIPNNGETPVWEPFLLAYGDELVVYYSDQGDPLYGQDLVHKTSKDLLTWSDSVIDVSYPVYTDRPGMTTVTELPNGKYMMTYEYGGGPGYEVYTFPVYYRIASDPRQFAAAEGHQIVSSDGVKPEGSPYVTWSSVGGKDGSVIVSSGTNQPVFVNRALGDPAKWETHAVEQSIAYSRHLRVLKSDPNALLIMGAGVLPPSTTNNISLSVVDFGKLIKLY